MTSTSPPAPAPLAATPGPGWPTRYRSLLTALLLAVAASALYLPSVRYGFVDYDDVRILRSHPELYGQPDLSANLRAIFWTGFPREEPLLVRDVTWVFDSLMFGFGNPLGYHLGNVLLHGIVVALLFVFLLDTTRRYAFALATAVSFLILAVHTEPVSWIMGRKDILSTLWMLLALCAQTRRLTTTGGAGVRGGWYLATMVCVVGGLLSKISALTFPLVLFLHAVFLPYLRGERPPAAPWLWGRGLVRELGLLLPGLLASAVVFVWYRSMLTQLGIFDRGYSAHGLDHLWNLLMIDPLVFWVYLRQTFLPGQLSVLYTWPTLHSAYPLGQVFAALATVVTGGGVGVWLFRRRKDLCFYYAAFFVLMITYLNLVFIGIWVAERYLYFSVFCLLAIAVSLTASALERPSPALRVGVLTAVAVCASLNLFQKLSYQRAWRDGETLWQYHIALPHPSPTAFDNLAAHYYAHFYAPSDPEHGAMALRKMAVVVEAGLAEFWPDRQKPAPQATWFLFFLQSLVQEVKGEPTAALASLLTSDRLRGHFDATNLNLARLYRKLAGTAANPQQRETYARAARERFAAYIALAFRGRPVPREVQQEMDNLATDPPLPFRPTTEK